MWQNGRLLPTTLPRPPIFGDHGNISVDIQGSCPYSVAASSPPSRQFTVMGDLTLGSVNDSNDDEDMKNASAAILMMSNNVKALRTARFELAERVDALHLYFSPFSIFVHLSLRFIVCIYECFHYVFRNST